MKITIEIWQCKFNDEWNCDITTSEDPEAKNYWAVENFCELLNLVASKLPKAKLKGNPI